MTDKSHAYQKIADGVEALEDVNLSVEETDVKEVDTGLPKALAQMLGAQQVQSGSQTYLIFTATIADAPEGERPEYPGPPSPEDIEDDEEGLPEDPGSRV